MSTHKKIIVQVKHFIYTHLDQHEVSICIYLVMVSGYFIQKILNNPMGEGLGETHTYISMGTKTILLQIYRNIWNEAGTEIVVAID